MNVLDWLVWGFAATVVLTMLLATSHAFGLTRMSIPYILGTMVTPNRDLARVLGIVMHLFNGWVFSIIYVLAFESYGAPAPWWLGVATGAIHATFVLTVALPALPAIHPRMASERRGPTVARMLEPPGFLAMNYGWQTPISVLFSHMVFGLILALFYRG